MPISGNSPITLLRRRWRVFLVVLVALAVQVGWSAYGFTRGAALFGWGKQLSLRNLGLNEQRGYYVGNESGGWFVVQIGWREDDPAADAEQISQHSLIGIRFATFGAMHIRFVGVTVLWTIVPNAVVAAVTGVRWLQERRRARRSDAAYDRGFAVDLSSS